MPGSVLRGPITPHAILEDFSKVPFAAHPRFQQVLAQRREFKADALEYRKIRTFMDEVRYNSTGNRVTLVKRRDRSPRDS